LESESGSKQKPKRIVEIQRFGRKKKEEETNSSHPLEKKKLKEKKKLFIQISDFRVKNNKH